MDTTLINAKASADAAAESSAERLDLEQLRERLATKQGKAYWRSLEELANTPEFEAFLLKEFPNQAAPLERSVDRRGFIKLMGASLALAGLTSCVRPYTQEKILPYVRAPEELIPGQPLFYATALTYGGFAKGVLAESHQGRPTRVEGNPDHPASLGSSSPQMQAAPLTLYDPDRSQFVTHNGSVSSYGEFVDALTGAVSGLPEGRGLHILSETVTSPTLARQLAQVLETYPQAQWHQYDPLTSDTAREGAQLAFGQDVHTFYDFSQADIILSLGADFLGEGPAQLTYSRAFAARRRVLSAEDTMNRLYAVEPYPTVTGSMADHRLALRPSRMEAFARAVARGLGVDVELGSTAALEEVPEGWLQALLDDLREAQGRCIVIAGDEQPVSVQVLAHAINHALGNAGATVIYTNPVVTRPVDQTASLQNLTRSMVAGEVEVLVVLGGNPAYTAPADFAFAEALATVPFSVHLSLYFGETSVLTDWHVPHTHELETWSDARAFNGVVTIMQPLIEPLYNGVSAHELLSALLGDAETTPYELVRATYEEEVDDLESFWRQTLYQGTVNGTALEPIETTLQWDALRQLAPTTPTGEGLEIAFRLDPNILDGRYANNGWLQELPKPLTKLTWDNAALIAPSLAVRRGLSTGDLVTLTHGERSLVVPIWILPGQADNTVVLHLGYGRSNAGNIGTNVGFNAYVLRTSESLWHATGAQMVANGDTYPLVSTQLHYALFTDGVDERHIVRHGTLAELREHPEHPEFVHPVEHPDSDLYGDWAYPGYAWGMVVDMNVCTGCSACVIACQSENNIPIVGKEQVALGREMHWIRVDAYYGDSLDDPTFYHMPMMCQHCEKAPCEPVCPVAATVHDHEGLNLMVYNRCVGTRYCSNNCPYKVRRFNFFQYAELDENALALYANPDVTVRSRGVMEKCTYCVQRIKEGTRLADNEGRKVQDDEIVTACQSACPTQAIVFGDISDPESSVRRLKGSVLNYGVLSELNTEPRTTYLAKLWNPHPSLAVREPEAEAG